MAERDPIINKPSGSSASTSKPSADRVKPISGNGPAFVGNDLKGFPSPSNPYSKGR